MFGGKIPCAGTIRGWILRFAYSTLQTTHEKAEDWALLSDATITIGQHKTLVAVGTRMTPLIERGDLTLAYSDIKMLALHSTRTLNGEEVCENGEKALGKIGGLANSLTTDQGSDMKRGGRLLQSINPKMKCIYDIPHKMALVVKDALENDQEWMLYLSDLSKTIPLIQQTELAAIKPPSLRTKARYMSADVYVKWYIKTSSRIVEGRLEKIGISNERFQEYFGWFDKYKKAMKRWEQMFLVVNIINQKVRTKGISEATYDDLLNTFDTASVEDNDFVRNALDAINEEVEKLEPGQVVLGSTEIVESLIGRYKLIGATTGQGINSHALAMGNLISKRPDLEELKQIMAKCSIKETLSWVKKMIGDGLAHMQRTFYRKTKQAVTTV